MLTGTECKPIRKSMRLKEKESSILERCTKGSTSWNSYMENRCRECVQNTVSWRGCSHKDPQELKT